MLYRFGRYELDEEAGELRCDGEPLALQPKPFALLRTLLRERDRVVPHDELLAELWPDAVVAPGSLTKAVSLARRAVGDTGRGERIRSLAKRGYRFVGDVAVAAPRAASVDAPTPGADGPRPSARSRVARPLVGRDEALARLVAAFERAGARRGGVALVTGAPGIGKTRLVEAFTDELRARGAAVAIGRARDGVGVPAFWLWAQVLRRLLDDPHARADVLALAGRAGELAALVPELAAPEGGERRARASTAPDSAEDHARFLLFDAVARALRRASERRPLAIVLEDLQWAGLASLRLLEHVAFEIADASILVIATVRDEHRAPDAPVDRTLALLRTQHAFEPVALRALSRGEVAALLEHELGGAVPVDVVSEIFARTEGVPLFVGEAARALDARREGDERDAAALARRALAVGSPAAPRVEWIDRAFEALDAATRESLAVAATIGREFAIPLLASACDRAPRDLLLSLERAERAGVVSAPVDPAEPWRFAHALFQEAAVRPLGRAERASLHVRVADHLEASLGDEAERAAAELAHHHHEGLVVGD
ncbi:MAG: AAA family ATPase, partial [Myxococcales bacterium]|nr:AAA family ATPase [Myxococcales bacterium]